jgi:hypothetical protein
MGLVNCFRSGWKHKVQWLLLLGLLMLTLLVGPAALEVSRAQSAAHAGTNVQWQIQEVEPLAVQWNNTRSS